MSISDVRRYAWTQGSFSIDVGLFQIDIGLFCVDTGLFWYKYESRVIQVCIDKDFVLYRCWSLSDRHGSLLDWYHSFLNRQRSLLDRYLFQMHLRLDHYRVSLDRYRSLLDRSGSFQIKRRRLGVNMGLFLIDTRLFKIHT